MDEFQQQPPSMMPVAYAIVFAGIVIAIALYVVLRPSAGTTLSEQSASIPEVSAEEHILGNPDAPIKIVEYADLDCQYCRTFHSTLKSIMAVYGQEGHVAWVYRHFPIVELHPNAPKLAEASECVAELGGNEAFWKFVDGVFTSPPINNQFDMERLETTAAIAGAPVAAFNECLASGRHREKVSKQFAEATEAGGEGTPHTIILSNTEDPIALPGSQPYVTMKALIDNILTP